MYENHDLYSVIKITAKEDIILFVSSRYIFARAIAMQLNRKTDSYDHGVKLYACSIERHKLTKEI